GIHAQIGVLPVTAGRAHQQRRRPLPAVARLRELYDMRLSNDAIIRAEQRWEKGDVAAARAALATALSLAHGWDRTWARAARLAMRQGDTALAREY
ncbi:hypothetical protein, partial [Listeria seeligeri]|uniref:hypothetical protein n=1 Tax=Listeria seeligeri TaxID=1640 RepID=UPI0022EA136F